MTAHTTAPLSTEDEQDAKDYLAHNQAAPPTNAHNAQ